MIIPDVNILIHAYNSHSNKHEAARLWWERTVASPRPIGMPWVTMLGFVRIMTQRSILENPVFPAEAIRRVRSWLACPRVEILLPGESHSEILFQLLEDLGTAGNLTTDAHLAALAIEYQCELASTDADFARFDGLRWFNPLS
ncbi:MAG: type II toxin-antitoxin system VapC family toxin [Acidobacteriia bacterium]|nr:type II toxin-antitoxin system VapC family toxin [Terriglobia bacterium]